MESITDPRANALPPEERYATTFGWDNERRLMSRTECEGFEYLTEWVYDENGNLLTLKRQADSEDPPSFQEWNWAYRVNNTVETATDPANNSTAFAYDLNNRLVSTTDAEGRVWQIAYDSVNRISVITDPMGNPSESRTYTDNSMLASIGDARGNVTQMAYDDFDRLDTRTYPDNTFEQMTYNQNNQVIRYDLTGRLKSISTPTVGGDPSSGTFGFDYDSAGRLVTQTTPSSAEVGYELDENGNRTKLIWPDAYYAQYFFDKLNRLTDIKLNGAMDAAVHFDYDPLSRRTGITYINGASCTYSWELNNDLSSLAHSFTDSSVTFSYGYNTVHQVTSQSVDEAAYMWQPDASAMTAYSPANNLNQYPAVAGDPFEYNENGCLTAGPYTSAAFDVLNRLTQVVSGGVTNNYWTDPLNRQVQKESDSVKTGFLHDGPQLIADYDDTPTLKNRYVPASALDDVLIQVSDGDATLTFLHRDQLGSTVAQTDDSGMVLNRYNYSPFGETPSLAGTILGFTGQRYDAEIGLYSYRARYYAPAIGRFLQVDPINFNGGDLNLYAYVGNDPVSFVDPLGLEGVRLDNVQANYHRDLARRLKDSVRTVRDVNANFSGLTPNTTNAPSDISVISAHASAGGPLQDGNDQNISNDDLRPFVTNPTVLKACQSAAPADVNKPTETTAADFARTFDVWTIGYEGDIRSFHSPFTSGPPAVLYDPSGTPVAKFPTPMTPADWNRARSFATTRLFD